MQPLSDKGKAGSWQPGSPVFVLHLRGEISGMAKNSDQLEFGFGKVLGQGKAKAEPGIAGEADNPIYAIAVEYPQSGGSLCLSVDSTGELKEVLKQSSAFQAFSLDVFKPFDFGGISYDPLGSMAQSLSRLTPDWRETKENGRSLPLDRFPGAQSRVALMALWAAIETDLHRFAKDPGFTAALDATAQMQAEEYRRFARLNELYRDIVMLLVPYGIAPRRWNAWLRGLPYRPRLPAAISQGIETLLAGKARRPGEVFGSIVRLLARYGTADIPEGD